MTSIKVIYPPSHIPAFYRQADGVFLDVPEGFSLRLTKGLEQLTELAKISQQAALSVSLPPTALNLMIFADHLPLAVHRATPPPLEVEVWQDGQRLPINKVRLLEQVDGQSLEVEFYGAGWIDDLEALPLNTVDAGTFEYTEANVLATWADPTALASPTLASYGGWNTPGDVTRKDLRFWFNLFKLMRLAFCKIGWEFESPFYEGPTGSRWFGYLSGEKWFSYSGKQYRQAISQVPASSVFVQVGLLGVPEVLTGEEVDIDFQPIDDEFPRYGFHPSFLYPGRYYQFFDFEPMDFHVEITGLRLTLPPTPPGEPAAIWYVKLLRIDGLGRTEQMDERRYTGSTTETVTYDLDITFHMEENGAEYQSYALLFGYADLNNEGSGGFFPYTMEDATVTFRPDPFLYVPDDTIALADLIDKNLNGLDLFKAMVHPINGKIETDYVARKVTLYPPYRYEDDGEFIEGFFRRTSAPIPLTDLVQPLSRKGSVRTDERNRFVQLQFKSPTDAYIDEFSTVENPFSFRADLGSGKAAETKLENNLFEPTIERFAEPAEVGGTGIYLPALWDNIEGEISMNVGYRIGYNYGLQEQETEDEGVPYTFSWEGGVRSSFGYISQRPTRPLISGDLFKTISFTSATYDLYRLFYAQWLREQFSRADFEFLLWLDLAAYEVIDFREPVGFHYGESYLLYQVTSVKDFDTSGRMTTPVAMNLLNNC